MPGTFARSAEWNSAIQQIENLRDGSVAFEEDSDDSEERQKEDDYEGNKTVAGDALLVTERAQALDSAGGQIADQSGIGGRRALEVVTPATE
jgi:hypothetical protein